MKITRERLQGLVKLMAGGTTVPTQDGDLPEVGLPRSQHKLVYLLLALIWMGVVFGSYFFINFDSVWSKVAEILGLR